MLQSAGSFQETEARLKVLGVNWDPVSDVLKFEGVCIPADVVGTKRVLLSLLEESF